MFNQPRTFPFMTLQSNAVVDNNYFSNPCFTACTPGTAMCIAEIGCGTEDRQILQLNT